VQWYWWEAWCLWTHDCTQKNDVWPV